MRKNSYKRIALIVSCLCVGAFLFGCGDQNKVTEREPEDNVEEYVDEIDDGGILNADTEWSEESTLPEDALDIGEDAAPVEESNNSGEAKETTDSATSSEVSNYVSENSNDNIYIANMSGRDLSELVVTFNAGTLQNVNILGESKLNDGNMFVFTVGEMQTLRNAKNLTLTMVGTARNGDEVNFGTISVVDPSGITLVLTADKNEYRMYIN